jgi:hypothetical protein
MDRSWRVLRDGRGFYFMTAILTGAVVLAR